MAALHVPRVIGHRGAAEAAPENTLESFAEAKRQGAAWVEYDAKLTADNAVILLHDDTIDRTSNGTGLAAQKTLAELKALDAGSWHGTDWAGARIPTLAETMAKLDALGLGSNIEIKPCPGRDRETACGIITELRRFWGGRLPASGKLPLISSFAYESLLEAHEMAPELPLGLLLEDNPADWRQQAERIQAVSVHCWDRKLTAGWARDIKAAGFGLLVYTVNDVDLARRLFDWGVDAVFTDAPARLLAGLD
ncbi:MAG TPA: glycerophosphodiester phosphodiesterase [Dongiaceae bacterium]|nr:glycerophosphodiester phosphodiesterase [Dongiaceae bacterium]